jgi:hypothetical protein
MSLGPPLIGRVFNERSLSEALIPELAMIKKPKILVKLDRGKHGRL